MFANKFCFEIDVVKVVKGLDVNKRQNYIPLKVLRECDPSLATLFNLSMSTCTSPE